MAGSLQIKHGTKIQVAYDVPAGQQPQFNMICTFNKALDESAFLVSIPIVDGKMLIPGKHRSFSSDTERGTTRIWLPVTWMMW